MIKVMLVAGRDTKKLSNFLNSRGTYNIVGAYSSLSEESSQIMNSIIHVDKLVYVYMGKDQPMRADMLLLIQLLGEDHFYRADEIIFIASNSPDADRATEFFEAAMDSCKYTNFSVVRLSTLTFADIYSATIGTSGDSNGKSVFKSVYLKERNSEADTSYLNKDTSKWVVEAFDYSEQAKYEKTKEMIKNLDTSSYTDSEYHDLGTLSSPDFPKIDATNTTHQSSTYIFTGDGKTGKTTWALATAVSARRAGQRVLLLDLTKKNEMKEVCAENAIECTLISFSDLLSSSRVLSALTVLSLANQEEFSVIPEMMQWLFARQLRSDLIIITIDIDRLKSLDCIIDSAVSKTFFMSNPIKWDIEYVKRYIDMWKEKSHSILIINDVVNLMSEDNSLDVEAIKQLVPAGVPVIKNITYANFRVDASIYAALRGA